MLNNFPPPPCEPEEAYETNEHMSVYVLCSDKIQSAKTANKISELESDRCTTCNSSFSCTHFGQHRVCNLVTSVY